MPTRREWQRRAERRGGRRAVDRQHPLDRLVADALKSTSATTDEESMTRNTDQEDRALLATIRELQARRRTEGRRPLRCLVNLRAHLERALGEDA